MADLPLYKANSADFAPTAPREGSKLSGEREREGTDTSATGLLATALSAQVATVV